MNKEMIEIMELKDNMKVLEKTTKDELEKLNKKYNIVFPKGAGSNVDEVGKQLVSKYGKNILESII